jgi:16S rRNA (guanine966-N2)-methyltransferase
MRIVGGKWAGRDLVSPGARIRPTAEAVREGIMLALGDELRGASVLDLFAGTGALGLEALSRGARRCDFVENGPGALHSLKANVAALRVRQRTRIFDRDAIPFVDRLPAMSYDIAFADPPYGSRKLDRVLERWQAVSFSRILVLEHATEQPVRGGTTRRFGDTAVTILRARRQAADTRNEH